MDFKLAKEIYGNPWFVDPFTFVQLSKVLESMQNGIEIKDEVKANQFGIMSNDLVFTPRKISNMDVVPKDSIAIYHFDSVITKGGGMSHHGTVEIAEQMRLMEANENVIGHIFKIESGGGSVNAIKYIREVSAKLVRIKPLVSFIEDIGASAAMYIASDSDHIIANSKDAIVGSIGTMMSLEGFKNGTEDKTGKRHIRIYASQSINKNKEFEDAINDLNFDLIRSKILDPHCKEFITDMEINRPNITPIQKTGATIMAGEAVGTLIDEIGNFQLAVDKVRELSKVNSFNNNQNSIKMDLNELKADHPKVYAQAIDSGKTAGVKAEKDRSDAWLVFNDVAPEKVKAGIESGLEMTKAEELSFMRMAQNAALQSSLENESADDLAADKKTGKVKPEAKEEDKAMENALDELGIEEKEAK